MKEKSWNKQVQMVHYISRYKTLIIIDLRQLLKNGFWTKILRETLVQFWLSVSRIMLIKGGPCSVVTWFKALWLEFVLREAALVRFRVR